MITERIGSHFLWIQGFRDARVVNSETALHDLRGLFNGIELQLLRADRIGGIEHMVFAARNAVDSFTGKGRRAKHLSIEFLLFATGEHQIVEAIKFLGVTESSTELALVGLCEDNAESNALIDKATDVLKGTLDDSVLDVITTKKQEDLKKAYNFSDKLLNASKMPGETESGLLKRLVIERSALLVLEN
jgi:tRNA threonylcarbamoyladenosine modification (KEOPS) complex Cgi121 subunit